MFLKTSKKGQSREHIQGENMLLVFSQKATGNAVKLHTTES